LAKIARHGMVAYYDARGGPGRGRSPRPNPATRWTPRPPNISTGLGHQGLEMAKKRKKKIKKGISRPSTPKKKSARKNVARSRSSARASAKKTRSSASSESEVAKAIQAIQAQAENDAILLADVVKRTSTEIPAEMLCAVKEKCQSLLDATAESDADYSPLLPSIALELALDPTGTRGITPDDWTVTLAHDGRVLIRRDLSPLPPIGEAIEVLQPLIVEILRAVFSRPRDLRMLRAAAGEVLQVRESTVTLADFLRGKGIPRTRIGSVKNRWRHTKVTGAALPAPVSTQRRNGQPHQYHRDQLIESWSVFRATLSL